MEILTKKRKQDIEEKENQIPNSKRKPLRQTHIEIAFDIKTPKSTPKLEIKSNPNPNPNLESPSIRNELSKSNVNIPLQETKPKLLKQPLLFSSSNVSSPSSSKRAPPNWKEMWDLISEMRKKVKAPVDAVGCQALADRDATPQVFRFQTLVGLMLSAQTKDIMTGKAIENLKKNLKGGLTVDSVLNEEVDKIDSLIKLVTYHYTKAKNMKATAKVLKENYKGDIPSTLSGLEDLPGVGRKMAMLCMQVAWEQTVGIGVDVHVHRIANRLGWVKNTKTPEQTRKELESWLPVEYWKPINQLFVGFGQTICTPTHPKCKICKVNHLCPSAFTFK